MDKTFYYVMAGVITIFLLVTLGWAFYPASVLVIDLVAACVLVSNVVLFVQNRKLNREAREKLAELNLFVLAMKDEHSNVVIGASVSPESNVDKATREI
jgi:Flp pilus assembly protein TadB